MINRFWRTSVQFRLVSFFLILSLSSVIAVGWLTYLRARAELSEATRERLESIAAFRGDAMRQWVDAQRRDLLVLSSWPELQNIAATLAPMADKANVSTRTAPACRQFQTLLDDVLRTKQDFKELFLLTDVGGRITCSTEPTHIGQSRALDRYYIEGRQHTFVHKVYPSPVTGQPVVTVATPLTDRSGTRHFGVLAVHLNLDEIDRLLRLPAGLGEGGEIYLVDQYNVFTSAQRFGRERFPRGVHSLGIDAGVARLTGSGRYNNYSDTPVFGAWRWLDDLGVALLAELPESVAFAPSHRLAVNVLSTGFLCAGVLALGVLFIARRITQPVLAINQAARAVAAGDLTRHAPVQGEDEVGALARTFNDMTDRLRRLYDQLAESTQLLSGVFENSTALISVKRADGRYLLVNRQLQGLLGRSQEALRELTDFDLFPKEIAEQHQETDRQVLETGRPLETEELVPHPDGWHTYLSLKFPLLAPSGTPAATCDISTDITERKRADAALRQSEERFAKVFEAGPFAIVITSLRDGRFLDVNAKFVELTGYTRDEIIGHSAIELGFVDPAERAPTVAMLHEHGGFRDIETRLRSKSGETRQLLTSAARITLGDEPCVIGMVLDVTERRQAQRALEESQERLRQAQKLEAIGRLAGGVAHDFNNLLTVILGYCGVMQGRLARQDPMYGELEEIRRAGERAAALTQQLLAFGRKQTLAPRVLDLNHVITDLDQMFRRVVGENIRLVTRLDRSLGTVMVDRAQLEQVILNLVFNARDAMPTGGTLTIETTNVDLVRDGGSTKERPAGPFVRLRVQDTGCGMDEETQRRIFEPFFTTKAPGKGTGLGLATIYGIVQQSQGHIEIDSAIGRGSTFTIFLPRMAAAAEPRPAPAQVRSIHGSETILVVEDEELVRNLVRDMLRMHGYQLLVAPDAEEALMIGEKHKAAIDLIITDVVLPGMSGLELLERVARIHPEARMIAMSGYANEVIARHGALMPGVSFVQKPFQLHELTRRIREVLDAPRESVDSGEMREPQARRGERAS